MCQCPDNTTGLYCREAGDTCLNREKCMEVANDGTCNVSIYIVIATKYIMNALCGSNLISH